MSSNFREYSYLSILIFGHMLFSDYSLQVVPWTLCDSLARFFETTIYYRWSKILSVFAKMSVHSNLLRILHLCVEISMHFRTAIDHMMKVCYRLRHIVDTKTYWVMADLLFYCILGMKWIIPWKFYNDGRLLNRISKKTVLGHLKICCKVDDKTVFR